MPLDDSLSLGTTEVCGGFASKPCGLHSTDPGAPSPPLTPIPQSSIAFARGIGMPFVNL
jgi:hypothetical protein